jgi:site-specific recombinase XerD
MRRLSPERMREIGELGGQCGVELRRARRDLARAQAAHLNAGSNCRSSAPGIANEIERIIVTFAEIMKRALTYSKANKRSYDHDELRMPALTKEFGNRIAEDVTRGIQKWLDSKAGKWSPATRNRYLALLKLTYRLAEEDGAIKFNPVRLVRQSKEDNSRVRYLSDAEETTPARLSPANTTTIWRNLKLR